MYATMGCMTPWWGHGPSSINLTAGDIYRAQDKVSPVNGQQCFCDRTSNKIWNVKSNGHKDTKTWVDYGCQYKLLHIIFGRGNHCPYNSSGNPLGPAPWDSSLADFNLCLFLVIKHNFVHNRLDKVCEFFQEIIETEVGFRELLTFNQCDRLG